MATMIVYVMQVSSDMALLAAYAGLFTSAFLAATILPISSEAVLVGLMATGQGNLFVLFLVATIGNILGSVVNWFLASGIVEFGNRRWSPKNQRRYERARIMFCKYGAWTLLFAWLPVIGDAFTLVAGAARMNFGVFVVLVAIGKAARYAMIIGGGFWLFPISSA